MFRKRLKGKYLKWYLRSAHKKQIDHVGQALQDKGYRSTVIQNHLLEWIRFSNYTWEHQFELPSNILSRVVEGYLCKRLPKGSQTRRRGIRAAIRIFLETDEKGQFTRRMKKPRPLLSRLYQQWVPQYVDDLCHQQNLSPSTLRKREVFLRKFTDFLEKNHVQVAEEITPDLVLASFTDLGGWGQEMRMGYATALRTFLRWGYCVGVFPKDLSCAVMTKRRYADARIPDVLSEEETEKILSSIDRTTAIGKRNFAIILLAACYGLRPCDIRELSLENIRWREGLVCLTQSKTKKALVLPLLSEVSTALIDYLQKGRPPSDSRKMFLRHLAPYEPFSKDNNLAVIMHSALDQAGMSHRKGSRGLYLLRHSLATRLLKEGQSLQVIAEVLGHGDLNATLIYAKVNLPALRTVAMSIEEGLS